MQEINGSSGQHVAVFAFPFASQAASLLSFVGKLSAAAPDVRFSFFSRASSNAVLFSGANACGYDNIKACNVWDGTPEGHVPSDDVEEKEEVKMYLEAAPESFRKGMDEAVKESGRKISCLVTDAILCFAGVMAEEMEVPWVAVWMAAPWAMSAHVHTDLIRKTVGVDGTTTTWCNGNTLNFIPGFSAICLNDLPEGIIFGDLESPLACMLRNMGHMLAKAATVAINSYEGLEPITITNDLKSKFQKLLSVGPFPLTLQPPPNSDKHGCIAWLNKHKAASVAYISFGTVVTLPPNEVVALAEALEASGVPFLWSFRGSIKDDLPKGFLGRTSTSGKIVPWAPQLQVLENASTGVFLTHGGWNSMTESITGGVPVICRPVFADQRLNTRMAEDVWKIGVGVEGGVLKKSGVVKALELILWHDEGKKMKENIGILRDLTLKAVGPNGSSIENFKTLLEVITKQGRLCY